MPIQSRANFYKNILEKKIFNKNDSILVCGGDLFDKTIFESLEYKNVVISNLDNEGMMGQINPYTWEYQDVQKLTYENNKFDHVVIHACIHHTQQPHKTLLELYRVAKKSVLIFEARDSNLSRLFIRLGITEEYECSAVHYNELKSGGVNNTAIPNYVFRWTEEEILKTLKSYAPEYKHIVDFYYATSLPAAFEFNKSMSQKITHKILYVLSPIINLLTSIARKQQNLLCIHINKSKSLKNIHPWIKVDENGVFKINKDWFNSNKVK